jgi:hypothetical protein
LSHKGDFDSTLFFQAAVVLFGRVLDLDNFWVVLDVLPTEDYLELAHRVGFLNLMNPVAPDRFYSLDLRIYEHRELCKVVLIAVRVHTW